MSDSSDDGGLDLDLDEDGRIAHDGKLNFNICCYKSFLNPEETLIEKLKQDCHLANSQGPNA